MRGGKQRTRQTLAGGMMTDGGPGRRGVRMVTGRGGGLVWRGTEREPGRGRICERAGRARVAEVGAAGTSWMWLVEHAGYRSEVFELSACDNGWFLLWLGWSLVCHLALTMMFASGQDSHGGFWHRVVEQDMVQV